MPFPSHTRVLRLPRSAGYSPGSVHKIRGPEDVVRLLRPLADVESVMCFWVVGLNSQSEVLAYTELTRGTVNASPVQARDVFRWALFNDASQLIVASNHPSGEPTPSSEDRAVARQLVEAGRLLNMPVHDHVILGKPGFVSLATMGLM
jgi:DNA repair protein RadC